MTSQMIFENNEWFETFIDHTDTIIICVDAQGIVLVFNHAAEEAFGLNSRDVIGNEFFSVCSTIFIEPSIPNLRSISKKNSVIKNFVTKINKSEDEKVYLEWTISPVFSNEKLNGFLLSASDVTGLRALGKKQTQNKADTYFENIINHLPHYIFWKDTNSQYQGGNTLFLQYLGMDSTKELAGKSDYDLSWSKEQSDHFIKDDKAIMKTGLPKLDYEEKQKQIDGSEKTMLVSKVPMFNEDGTVKGILGICTDITTRKKMEAELRIAKDHAESANKIKSEFLAVASHELRIPLAGILGMVDFLKDETLSHNERQQYLSYLTKSSQYLLSLINDILDFTKLEAGQQGMVTEPINLSQLLQETVALLIGSAKAKNLELILDIPPNLPNNILADQFVLKRILMNLAGNAIKFTREGHVTVRVECLKESEDAADFAFIIEDTGIGIPANKINIIFDRFRQIGSAYTRSSSQLGTGLGLAITKKLVALMDGQIQVESELGKGSTFIFTVRFPLQTSASSELLKKFEKKHRVNAQTQTPYKVLLVEDDLIIRIIHEKYLKQLGCDILIAETGMAAIELVSKNEFDVIFMDVGLPDIDGFSATKLIRQLKSEVNKHTIVIGVTGYSDHDTREKCLSAGMDEILVKPIKLDDLKGVFELVPG